MTRGHLAPNNQITQKNLNESLTPQNLVKVQTLKIIRKCLYKLGGMRVHKLKRQYQ